MTAATLTRPTEADRHWRRSAACRGTDPELFFPRTSNSFDGQVQIAVALAVCRWCPVQPECLASAMAVDRQHRGNQVVGGRWFDHRGRPSRTPPPFSAQASRHTDDQTQET